jgi:uncharacterized protein
LISEGSVVLPVGRVAGHYLALAPQPEHEVDIMVSLLRERRLAFTATLRGDRLPATATRVALMHILAPAAPLAVAIRARTQGMKLWLRRIPVVQR